MPSRHVADIRQVESKTGRSLDEWCELLESNETYREIVYSQLSESEAAA